MKSKVVYLTASAAALLITTASLHAANEPDSFYIKVDAGASFQQDLALNLGGPSVDASFNPGVRTAINLGYNVSKSFAVEFETGSIWNSFDKIGGVSVPSEVDLNLYQFPVLAKGILKLPLENGLTPYIGGGAGGILGRLDESEGGFDDSDTDFVFAYQAEAGLKYAINENIEVGIGYKFTGTTGYHFFDVRTDDSFNHSVLASFVWNF